MKRVFRHAIVLGGSSGIGAELVRRLAASGTRVLAVGRDVERLDALRAESPSLIQVLSQDLNLYDDPASVSLDAMAAGLGGLDLVVWSAAIMPLAQPSGYDTALDVAVLRTNLLAAVAWLNAAADRFQAERAGTILGIGSVAGDRGRLGQPAYNTSKAALHTYLECLRNRLDRLGVTVVTVKPGPTDTPLLRGAGFKRMMPAPLAARRILGVAHRPGEHYLALSHRLIFAVVKVIPSWIFRRLTV